jgi:hypothetical protein
LGETPVDAHDISDLGPVCIEESQKRWPRRRTSESDFEARLMPVCRVLLGIEIDRSVAVGDQSKPVIR